MTITDPAASSETPSPQEAGSLRVHTLGRPRLEPWPTCPHCAKEFRPSTPQKRAIAAGRPAYCSRTCQKAAGTETRPCAECGTDITRQRGHGFRGDRAFCSPECRSKQSMKPRVRVTVPCRNCGADVERTPSALAEGGGVAYCDIDCKAAAMRGERVERPERPCETCGDVMRLEPDEVSKGKRFCSRKCAGVGKRRQPGERYIDGHGYAWVTTAEGVSRMEHQIVMEAVLGRPLLPEETVHHKTGGVPGRSNNVPSNLELWSGRHPKGHRVEDIVGYCVEMLALYAPDRLAS